jgi:hypothetical protein
MSDRPIASAATDGSHVHLSLAMIVRNAARTLEPCLASIRPWVDEMVVVDTGSVDETPEIAGRLGARVFLRQWFLHLHAGQKPDEDGLERLVNRLPSLPERITALGARVVFRGAENRSVHRPVELRAFRSESRIRKSDCRPARAVLQRSTQSRHGSGRGDHVFGRLPDRKFLVGPARRERPADAQPRDARGGQELVLNESARRL